MKRHMRLGTFGDWLKVATVFGAAGAVAAALSAPLAIFDIVSHARVPIGLTLVGLALFHAPAAQPRWAIAALACATVTLAPASAFLSPSKEKVAGARDVSVLFHNTWEHNGDPTRFIALVRKTEPDIVALVEVLRHWHPELETLQDIYPHRMMAARYGQTVILSKTPITPLNAPRAGASIVFAEIAQADGPPLRIAVTHFTRPWPWDRPAAQREQIARFADAWRANGEADIVVGDFNGAPWSPPLKILTANTDLRPATGDGGTWHAGLPAILRLPIDNGFVGPRIGAVHREVLGPTGSDHRPVLFEMSLAD